MMTAPSGDRTTAGPRVSNNANNSKVDAQFGYVEGDAIFHKHETIYQVHSTDSPEQKFTVARSHLDGGTPRVAEDLIGQALDAGLATTEIAYYYLLSVLSERSLNQLGGKELDKLDRGLRLATRLPFDDWQAAVDVIRGLLACVLPADRRIETQDGDLQLVIRRLEALAHARRTEIIRHLDMIFDSATQDEVDRLNAQRVAAERKSRDRLDRAWKFFHPPPEAPRGAAPTPLENGEPKSAAWTAAVFGVGGFVALLLLVTRIVNRWEAIIFPLGVLLLGGLLAGWFGSLLLALRIREAMKTSEENSFPEFGDDDNDDEDSRPERDESLKFAAEIWRQIDHYFTVWRPEVGKKRMDLDKWRHQSKSIRKILHARLVPLYQGSRVPVTRINWLIRWHAKRAARQWKDNGELPDFRRSLRPDVATAVSFGAGLVTTAGGVAWFISASSHSGLSMGLIGLVEAVAGVVGGIGATYLIANRRATAQEQAELDQIFHDEQREYERWKERLSDRPNDAEMGNWLDCDKSYLKAHAMKRCELTNQDIIAHVVLTAGWKGAKRARVRLGPPRYSAYTMLVFLLSYNGVRGLEVDLDFQSGAIYDEGRRSFRYDTLASTTVLEVGVQSAKGSYVRIGEGVPFTGKDSMVLYRIFQLTLVSGNSIEVMVDNYHGLLDETAEEDKTHLDQMARDSSGVAGALQILEAVAAEGREWIAREHERRNRHWQEWREWKSQALPDRAAIADCARPLGIGPHPE